MKLTSDNVQKTLFACLYEQGEDTSNHVKAQGVRGPIGFHPERLAVQKENIIAMLKQLPKEFMKSGGGGYTFLNGCIDSEGEQWGDQSSVDELICLGVAIGKVSFPMPREMWSALPGGVPYFTVDDIEEVNA